MPAGTTVNEACSLCVNPYPLGVDTPDRQWMALYESGVVITGGNPKPNIPTDTLSSSERAGSMGSWAIPRWGTLGFLGSYTINAGRQIIVADWDGTAGTGVNQKGYVLDTYGGMWPWGTSTPHTLAVQGPYFTQFPPWGVPEARYVALKSLNGQPIGQGGTYDGTGWIIDGAAQVYSIPGTEDLGNPPVAPHNTIRDFQVSPVYTGVAAAPYHFYVLYSNGAVGVYNAGPGFLNYVPPPGREWIGLNVEFTKSAVWMSRDGEFWGFRMLGGSGIAPPVLPVPSPYAIPFDAYRDMRMVPYRNPTRIWVLNSNGGVASTLVGTAPTTPAVTVLNTTTTTRPTVRIPYAESFGTSMRSYKVRVYTLLQTTQPNFSPGSLNGAVAFSDKTLTAASGTNVDDVVNVDLTNGTQYKAYAQVTSAAQLSSAWGSSATFTISIPPPSTPTLGVPTVNAADPVFPSVSLDVTANTVGAGEFYEYQVKIGGGAWEDVINGSRTTTDPLKDYFVPSNIPVSYRVRKFKEVPIAIYGAFSNIQTVTAPAPTGYPAGVWRVVDPFPDGGGPPVAKTIRVRHSDFDQDEDHGEFQSITRSAPQWTGSGVKGKRHHLTLNVPDRAAYDGLLPILSSGHTLLLMNIAGDSWWVRIPTSNYAVLEGLQPTSSVQTITLELDETVRPTV